MAQNFYKQNGSYFLEGSNQKIADVASLQNYAKLGGKEVAYKAPVVAQIPQGMTAINGAQYNTGDLQKANFSNIQPINGGLYGIPKVPSQISSDSLTDPSPTITPVAPDPLNPDSLMAGVQTSNEGILAQLKARDAQLAEQTNLTELQKRQADYAETNKTALRDTQQSTWNQYGLDANVAQVQQLMPQIQKTTAEFNALQEQNANLPIASRIIGGTQDRLTRQKAIEVAGLSAVAQAYQGNVDMARNIATDAINAQYKDQETYYNSLNDQISNAYTDLTAAEKKRADKLLIVNNERLRNIEAEKETKKNISDIAVTLAQKGIDNSIVNQVLKAPTYEEAIRLASASGGLKTIGNLTDLGNGNFRDTITGNIGTINEIQQQQNLAQGIVTTSTGDAYDIKSYATDPTHEAKIQSILNGIGKFNTIQDINTYIQSKYPNSPVTGEMIANAAGKYGVSWEMMTAIMAQDSSMGTAGKAVRTKNPGNVGNTDSGGTKQFNSWQEGVDAVAKNLAWRKTASVATTNTTTSDTKNVADAIIAGNAKLTDVPQKDRAAVISEIQNSGKNVAEIEQKQKTAESTKGEAVSIINTLLNSKSIGTATGLSSWTTKIPGTNAYSFGRSFAQLRDLLAMGNIDKLKGAMSDKDIEFLRNSATKLALGLPKDEFISELNKLKSKLENPTSSITTGTSGTTSSGIGYTIE